MQAPIFRLGGDGRLRLGIRIGQQLLRLALVLDAEFLPVMGQAVEQAFAGFVGEGRERGNSPFDVAGLPRLNVQQGRGRRMDGLIDEQAANRQRRAARCDGCRACLAAQRRQRRADSRGQARPFSGNGKLQADREGEQQGKLQLECRGVELQLAGQEIAGQGRADEQREGPLSRRLGFGRANNDAECERPKRQAACQARQALGHGLLDQLVVRPVMNMALGRQAVGMAAENHDEILRPPAQPRSIGKPRKARSPSGLPSLVAAHALKRRHPLQQRIGRGIQLGRCLQRSRARLRWLKQQQRRRGCDHAGQQASGGKSSDPQLANGPRHPIGQRQKDHCAKQAGQRRQRTAQAERP